MKDDEQQDGLTIKNANRQKMSSLKSEIGNGFKLNEIMLEHMLKTRLQKKSPQFEVQQNVKAAI